LIFSGFGYRAHDPKWAFSPLSGAGAAIHGGRFNPVGVAALYLSTTPEGAILEASHGFAFRFEPLTLCTYELAGLAIADLTDAEVLSHHGFTAEILASGWFQDKAEGRKPASWQVYEKLHREWSGILVPSFARMARPDMKNIVLWRWDNGPGTVVVHDPHARLPKNQRSWE
jgi:RES domain-containing protein